jgi:hypothetical protein
MRSRGRTRWVQPEPAQPSFTSVLTSGTHLLLCTHLVSCRALVQGLAFYDDFFGVSYPFGKYDQLFVPEFNQVRRLPPRLPNKRCLMCCEGAASLCLYFLVFCPK